MLSIGNMFLTKCEVFTHEAIKRVLFLPMRHSNMDALYVPTNLKSRMLKLLSILEKMHPDDLMYLHLTLLTNLKINQITYIQCTWQTLHPVISSKKEDDLLKEPG